MHRTRAGSVNVLYFDANISQEAVYTAAGLWEKLVIFEFRWYLKADSLWFVGNGAGSHWWKLGG